MTKRIYTCGPIAGTTYDKSGLGWRKEVFDAFPIAEGWEIFSPMRGKKFLRGVAQDQPLTTQAYEFNPLSSTHGILGRDRFDVANCDVMLANFLGAKERSIGSCVEFGWADAYRKPIVLVMEETGNPHDHLFVKGLPTYVTRSLEEAIHCIKVLLVPSYL